MAGHKGRRPGVRGGRQIVHKVKVTQAEERRLQHAAAAAGVTPVRYMVEAALAGEGWTPSQRRVLAGEFARAKLTLAGVARNLNQLTAYAHAERRFMAGVERLLPAIEGAMERLDVAREELRL